MTETILLNKSFDITEELIKKNPENENNIINDFNNYIIKVKTNSQINKSYVRTPIFKDDPPEIDYQNGIIKIHNNFQKYNNDSSNTETFKDFYKSITDGFKDYLKI